MERRSLFTKTFMVFLLALCSCMLWGSAFPLIKISYAEFQIDASSIPTLVHFAGFRYLTAGFLTFLVGTIVTRRAFVPKRESLGRIFRISLLQTVGQYVFMYIGMAYTTGVNASILNSSSVFFAIFLACFFFRQEKIGMGKILGCLVGFAGVILVNVSGGSLGGFTFLGEGCIILGAFSHSCAQALMRKYAVDENPFVISGWQFMMGGAIMILAGFLAGGRVTAATGVGVSVVFFLAVSSAVAFGLWSILLKYNPVSKVAVFAFMTPMFGVFLSALLLQEGSALTMSTWIALALVCAGIVLVNKARD